MKVKGFIEFINEDSGYGNCYSCGKKLRNHNYEYKTRMTSFIDDKGEIIDKSNPIIEVPSGEFNYGSDPFEYQHYCEKCFYDNFSYCDNCENTYKLEDGITSDSGYFCSQYCKEEHDSMRN